MVQVRRRLMVLVCIVLAAFAMMANPAPAGAAGANAVVTDRYPEYEPGGVRCQCGWRGY